MPAGSTRSCASTTTSSRARADGRRPAVRGADQRRQVALGGPVAAGGRAAFTTPLRAGSYNDTASRTRPAASDPTAESGVWTVSKPLPYDVHLAGSGRGVRQRHDDGPEREPRDRRLRPRRRTAPGRSITRQGHPCATPATRRSRSPLDRRLEARGRGPHRRARDRQQPGLVAARRAAAPAGDSCGGSVTLPFLATVPLTRSRATRASSSRPTSPHRDCAGRHARLLAGRLHLSARAGKPNRAPSTPATT